jgi:SAM-dependent methyltransferase
MGERARLREDLEALRDELTRAREEVRGLRDYLAQVDARVGGMHGWLSVLDERLVSTTERGAGVAGLLDSVVAEQIKDRELYGAELSKLARRVPDDLPLHGPSTLRLERFDAGLGGEVVGYRDGGADQNQRVYLGFEDFFRGSEATILTRQRAYLPLLERHAPVLDVGCGRGEMLQLLAQRDVEVAGIDIDPAMVEHCKAKGLEHVQTADAVDHLEAAAEGGLGAVFAAQVIEHLPYDALLRFLRGARRALVPGGVLVIETVNPHAPQALKHFWVDPTHQHPLFPEVTIALCRLTGFSGAYVWYPQGTGDPDRDHGEQPDYAVVAQTAPTTS